MRGSRALGGVAALALGSVVIPTTVRAEETIRDPGTYVVDRAGIIDGGIEQRLEALLRELEQKTTAQVKILTVPVNFFKSGP